MPLSYWTLIKLSRWRDFWVLYWLKSNGEEEFFVLTHKEMAKVQRERSKSDLKLTWLEIAEAAKKGVDDVLAKDLGPYESAWQKIVKQCSPKGKVTPSI